MSISLESDENSPLRGDAGARSIMLIRFAVENFRSINDLVELSFVATDDRREDARRVEGFDHELVTVAGIFGPNAAGKSNVLQALDWLRRGVRNSLLYWDEGIPIEPFAGANSDVPTSFWVDFVSGGTRYTYELEVTHSDVVYEGLFHYPRGRRRRIFERDGLELTLQDGLGVLAGTRQILTSRVLVLSLARRFSERLTQQAWRELAQISTQGLKRRVRGYPGAFAPMLGGRAMRPSTKLFEPLPIELPDTEPLFELEDFENGDRAAQRDQALALLRMADLGVMDVELVDDPRSDGRLKKPKLIHRFGERSAGLDFEDESEGTRQWFLLLAPLLDALSTGGVLIFDEMDASLHPKLTAEILRLFRDPATNTRNAQLLFTSHDPSLLSHLNRDQIWFVEKTQAGASKLYPVTDFGSNEVRQSHNLEKRYLDGRFGALPYIDITNVYKAMGALD